MANRFDEIFAQRMREPEFRERYTHTRSAIDQVQDLLRYIDTRREEAHLSKAALAHRIGMHPAAVRRMFTSRGGNPTLVTVLEMLNALDLELECRPKTVTTEKVAPHMESPDPIPLSRPTRRSTRATTRGQAAATR